MRKRLTEDELDRLRAEQITCCTGGELDDEPWTGFVIREDREPNPFKRRWHHDGLADGYGEDFRHADGEFATSYYLGAEYGTGVNVGERVVDATGTWELVKVFVGETEVSCPGREWNPDTQESASYDEPFKVQRSMAQLTPKPERRYARPRWYGDKRPNNRRATCVYCEERIGEEHGFLGVTIAVEIWKRIAELPTREELVKHMARTFFVDAYATHVEDGGEPYDGEGHPCEGCNLFADEAEDGHVIAEGGEDWFDVLEHIHTPPAALEHAEWAARKIEAEGGALLPGLYLYTCALPGKHRKDPDAEVFGHDLALQFMGHGVGWGDNHPDFDFDFPLGESWAP